MKAGGLVLLCLVPVALADLFMRRIPNNIMPVGELRDLKNADSPYECAKLWYNDPPSVFSYDKDDKGCYGHDNVTTAVKSDNTGYLLVKKDGSEDTVCNWDIQDDLVKTMPCMNGWSKFESLRKIHCFHIVANGEQKNFTEVTKFVAEGCKYLSIPYKAYPAAISSDGEEEFIAKTFYSQLRDVNKKRGLLMGYAYEDITADNSENCVNLNKWKPIAGGKQITKWAENQPNECYGTVFIFGENGKWEWRSFNRNRRDLLCKYTIDVDELYELVKKD